MNYFAHGRSFLGNPYFLAGTATPDWLNVADRRVRVRRTHALALVGDADPRVAAFARGVAQHHHDDDWFHRTAPFAELSWAFTVQIRDALQPDEGLRPSFLGHILVELLLDACLAEEEPRRLDEYYAALASLDPAATQQAISRLATQPTNRIALLVPRFIAERFLYDYLDDGKLLTRLNHVMRRVGLPQLPLSLVELLPAMRDRVRQRKSALLTPDSRLPTSRHP